jgi:HlyD family secretion protein
LFAIVASALGAFLMRKYHAYGFVAFGTFLLVTFRMPAKKLLDSALHPVLNSDMRRRITRWLPLPAIGAVAAALFLVHMDLRVGGEFTVLPVQNADVRAAVEGIISEVHADEGDSVTKGAPIVTLSGRDFQAELHKLKAQRDEADAKLKLLKAGSRPEEIEAARTLIAKAEERVHYAKGRFESDQKLTDQKLLSQRELDDTKEQLVLRNKELQEAEDHLRVLLAGSRKEEIEATEAEIRRIDAQERYLEDQVGFLQINSPIEGIVVTHKLKDRLGEAVHKGDLIAKVHELKTVSVEIAVPESEIADVKIGQTVVVKARAYPDRSFHGTVAMIAPVATKPEGTHAERVVLVTTRFDNPDLLLKPEMTGNAKISCGERRIGDIALRRFLRFIKVEFWSWW